ncbi:hypothetical protein SSS_02520 [Sarcoptes scabiei]|nr:hypothetical protein SSS_02520 [Sarcoptes scabiei]
MGTNLSSLKTIKQNEYLIKLTSIKHYHRMIINSGTNFFRSHSPILIRSDANFMNENIIPFLGDWIENNPTSLNLSSMIQVFYNKIQLLKKDSQKTTTINYNVLVWHGYNLAFIMRTMFKYMIETLTEENVIKNCRSSFSIGTNVTQTPIENSDDTKTINGHQDDGQQMIELLLSTLIEILVDLKIDDLSYSLHVESCKCFLVLLSVQMFSHVLQ